MGEKRVRNSRIEFLRLVCMFGIVLYHCMHHGEAIKNGTMINSILASIFLHRG